jgi:hypothetical protein
MTSASPMIWRMIRRLRQPSALSVPNSRTLFALLPGTAGAALSASGPVTWDGQPGGRRPVRECEHACQLAKRENSLRVMAEAVRWGKRGARISTISPGIIFTSLARDELTSPPR